MNVALWIATGLLAFVAAVGGVTKVFVPKEKLAAHNGAMAELQSPCRRHETLGTVAIEIEPALNFDIWNVQFVFKYYVATPARVNVKKQ